VNADNTDTITKIKEKLINSDQELTNAKLIRLYYPMGKLMELQGEQTPFELRIDQNTLLIGIIEKSFTWDSKRKGNDIELSGNDLVAFKKGIDDFESIFGTIPLTTGKHYWEITVLLLLKYLLDK